jgi:hypothetical protein
MHRFGSIRLDDLQREHSYGGWRAYAQSKLANALFTLELDRRLRARRTRYARAAYDEQLARSLWQASEELTGVAFPA